MKSSKLQTMFFKEKGIEAFNSQGEPDIDYVEWLEEKAVLPQFDMNKKTLMEKLMIEKAEKNNTIDLNAYAIGLDEMYEELNSN